MSKRIGSFKRFDGWWLNCLKVVVEEIVYQYSAASRNKKVGGVYEIRSQG